MICSVRNDKKGTRTVDLRSHSVPCKIEKKWDKGNGCERNFQDHWRRKQQMKSESLPVWGMPQASGPRIWQPSRLWPEGKKLLWKEHPGPLCPKEEASGHTQDDFTSSPWWERINHLRCWEESCMPKQRLRPQSPRQRTSCPWGKCFRGKRPKLFSSELYPANVPEPQVPPKENLLFLKHSYKEYTYVVLGDSFKRFRSQNLTKE